MNISGYWRVAALAASACVAACGGGGGGGSAIPFLPTATAPTTSPTTTTPTAPGSATVTLSGTATFESVPNPSGALVYASASTKPIRGATLEVLDSASSVLATTTTDGNGAYSVAVPSGTVVSVRVRAQMVQSSGNATWDVSVRDNTQSNAIYAIQSGTFSSGASSLTRDLNAPSGWGGSGYTATRAAAPFAVLDTVYTTQAKVLSVAPATAFPALRVYWSSNNVPASGDPALGQIGTTFFSDGSAGKAIYVLGKENVDTDEYDTPVIAHEWGHYYQASFSRDDSTGGSHGGADLLDRRVAFSEGWGNAWSGIALNRSNYTDSTGNAQAQGTNMALSAGASSSPGWFREASIQSILWNLNQQVGFQPIHATLTGPFKNGVPVTSIHPFAAAFNVAAPSSATALATLLTGQSVNPAGNDPFGTLETNNGGLALTLPMYRTAAIGTTSNACVSNQAGGPNKLGNFVYLRFTAPSARAYAIGIVSPAGVAADPDLVVYRGGRVAQSNAFGTSENASVSLQAGDNILVITDYNNVSASTCFTVTIN